MVSCMHGAENTKTRDEYKLIVPASLVAIRSAQVIEKYLVLFPSHSYEWLQDHLAGLRRTSTGLSSSVTGSARKPFAKGKLFGVRETTPPAVTRDLPITLPHEVKIDGIARVREFRPLRFEQFEASAGIHHEIDFAGTVTPEKKAAGSPGPALVVSKLSEDESLPYCAYRR